MNCVYLIRSKNHPDQKYVGITSTPLQRLADHNSGKSSHTSKYKTWSLVVAIKFEDDHKAIEFEKYLKSGSGRTFSNRHFW